MISITVDLSKATQEEVEYFFRLPHVGHAVDVLTHLESGVISVRLQEQGYRERENRSHNAENRSGAERRLYQHSVVRGV